MEDGKERMVRTPWSEKAIPFHEAARIGTQKVIEEHSTIGLVITSDGSFGELPRDNFTEAEEKTIQELKKQHKPFLVLVNSQMPYKEAAQKAVSEIQEKYQVTALSVNCDQLHKEDIAQILEKILYEFPVSQIQFFIPKWVEMLPADHELKKQLLEQIREKTKHLFQIRDITKEAIQLSGPYVKDSLLEDTGLSDGTVRVRVRIQDK